MENTVIAGTTQGTNGQIPNQALTLPGGMQMPSTMEEMQALIVKITKEKEDQDRLLAENKEKERRRQEEFGLANKIKAESRFGQTRKTLIARRVPNPEEIAPASDVFDYLEIVDLVSGNKKSKKKGVRVQEAYLEFYQAQKQAGTKFTKDSYLEAIEKIFGKTKDDGSDLEDDSDTE